MIVHYVREYNVYNVKLCRDHCDIDSIGDIKFNEFQLVYLSRTEEDFVNNYTNKLADVTKEHAKIYLTETENKISIKFFWGHRKRRAGKSSFLIRKHLHFLTIRKDTGDVYFGTNLCYNLKKKSIKSIRKNYFVHFLVSLRQKFRESLLYGSNDQSDIISDIQTITYKLLSKEKKLRTKEENFRDFIIEFFLLKKGVKYPNNFSLFFSLEYYRFNLKSVRKNNNHIIDDFMISNNLKGAKLRKILHETEALRDNNLFYIYRQFNSDWVNQEDDIFLHKVLSFDENIFFFSFEVIENLPKNECWNLYQLYKNYLLEGKVSISTYRDHIRFYVNLKTFNEDVKFKPINSLIDFTKEHLAFSELIEYHDKGYYIREYADYMYDIIEKEFEVDNSIYYPKILTNTKEYVDESSIQSNCVKTYIGKSKSMIISLRSGNIDSDERATLEINFHKTKRGIDYTIPQLLGKFNIRLGENWNEPIIKLKQRLELLVNDKRFGTFKLTKKFKDGKELRSESEWDNNGQLNWTSVDLTKYL